MCSAAPNLVLLFFAFVGAVDKRDRLLVSGNRDTPEITCAVDARIARYTLCRRENANSRVGAPPSRGPCFFSDVSDSLTPGREVREAASVVSHFVSVSRSGV
jgi:hypothetical protein